MTGSFKDLHDGVKRTHLAAVVAVGLLAAVLLGGGAAQANGGAKYDFRLLPRVGTPTTKFRAVFRAPFRGGEYTLEAVGPRRCPSVYEFTKADEIRRGDRVVLRLTASDDLYFRKRRRWCRGAYVGYVYFSGTAFQAERVIGYFSFGVGRFPVSLAR